MSSHVCLPYQAQHYACRHLRAWTLSSQTKRSGSDSRPKDLAVASAPKSEIPNKHLKISVITDNSFTALLW